MNKGEIWETALLNGIYDLSESKINNDKDDARMTFVTQTKEEALKSYIQTQNTARAREDSGTMRNLAGVVKNIGEERMANICLAEALCFEKEYLEGAKYFKEAKEYKRVIDCYWQELNITDSVDSLIEKIGEMNGDLDDPRAKWSHKINMHPTPFDIRDMLSELADIAKSDLAEDIQPWKILIDKAYEKVSIPKAKYGNAISVMEKCLSVLADYGILFDKQQLANLAYRCDALDEAVTLWEQTERRSRPKEYFQTKWNSCQYPEKLEYAEEMKDADWHQKVLDEYKNHSEVDLGHYQKAIVFSAMRKGKHKDDFIHYFAEMLTDASTIDDCNQLLQEAEAYGMKVNGKAVYALAAAKLNELDEWKRPDSITGNMPFEGFLDAVEEVQRIRRNIIKGMPEDGKDLILRNVVDAYSEYKDKEYSLLVFCELGKHFEERKKYKIILPYYEQARRMSVNPDFKRFMDMRWIVAKEKQAEWMPEKRYEYEKEAWKKRNELRIESLELPQEPELTDEYWNNLFNYAISLPTESASDDKSNKVETQKTQENGETNGSSTKKIDFIFGEYTISYNPVRKLLMIRTDEDQVKIIQGNIATGQDLYLENGRLFNTHTGDITPFGIVKDKGRLYLRIYDGNLLTNISFCVNI